MLIYWTMFAVPALSAMVTGVQGASVQRQLRIAHLLLLLAFMIVIGFRYEVGGDWFNYERIVDYISGETFGYTMKTGDMGFGFVAWVSTRIGFGATGPTFFCGAVLVYGLWRFGQTLAQPWLALTAAVPYLVIVVGMGYVRQSAAIGFLLLALIQFDRGSITRFGQWMLMAILFHVSALCVLPLAGIALVRKRPLAFIPLALVGVVLFFFLLRPRLDGFYENYVVAEYDSSGALIRLVMNAVPAILFLLYRGRFVISENGRALWTILSGLALALVVLVFLSPATTAIDRVGLYCIPLQLFVFGNIVPLVARKGMGQALFTFAIIVYYSAVMFVWLNYAKHAEFWLPYRFVFWQ